MKSKKYFSIFLTITLLFSLLPIQAVQAEELTDEELVEEAKADLVIPNADDIRGNITLPSSSMEGAAITWETDKTDVVNVNEQVNENYDDIPSGVVTRQETDTEVTLTATITYGEASATKEIPLTVKAKPEEKEYDAYLMTHFTGEHSTGEQIYFASSTDGLNWKDLNDGNPVLTSDVGEKGVRDPYLFRSHEGDKFYMIATDLRIANGKGWNAAQRAGSRSIIVWESTDLVNWSEPRMVEVAPEQAGNAWAPEAFYDEKTGEYVVFWASRMPGEEDFQPHDIYYAKTRDFHTFTEPQVYIDRPGDQHIIDTTIIEDDGLYYRYSGDGQLTIEKSEEILGEWSKVGNLEPLGLTGSDVEGPLIFKFNDREEWNLMVDQYATGKGYLPLLTTDLASGDFEKLSTSEYSLGSNKKRHGSVLNITQEEYDAVMEKWAVEVETPDEEEQEEPVLTYNFDETASGDTIQDVSGNSYTGTLHGNATYVTDEEKDSQVLYLDGTNETFASFPIGFFEGRDTVTVSMDIKAETVSGNFFTFTVGKDNQRYMFLRTRNNEIRNAITTGSWSNEQDVKTSTDPIQGKWMNITLVIEPTSMKMYKDGVLVDENNDVTVSMSDLGTDLLAYLGKSFYSGDQYFEGYFDNVKVYNRALNETEVLESNLDATDIGNFEVPGQKSRSEIDKDSNTITVHVKDGEGVDITNLTPTITVLSGSTVSPASGEAQDFTNPVTYTVTDEDGNTEEWTVRVKVHPKSTLPGLYADPHIAVFGDTYYLYPTTDGFEGWSGSQFKVFSSKDLLNWEDQGVILDLATDDVTWADNRAWAPAIAERDGNYYYYFSADTNIGVAKSSSPTGPFEDALGEPLIPAGQHPGQAIDPYVFTDDDGESYFYWGNGHLFGAKLNADMVSFAEDPVEMTPPNFREGVVVFKRNDTYYLMWSENDTRDENYQVAYATGDSPMGPWTKQGVILSKDLSQGIKATGHHTVLNVPNTEDYYMVYHRHAIPGGNGYNREVMIDKMEFNEDGTIKQVQPTLEGITEPVFIDSGNDTEGPEGKFTINNGDEFTNDRQITLKLEATDEESGVNQVRFSTDTEEWTEWEAYEASKPFTLPAGDGEKTVYVQFNDNAGNTSETYRQSITLDTNAPVIEFSGNEESYSVDAAIAINCSVTDEVSGVAFKECSVVEGPAYSFDIGENTVTATATDHAGNTAEAKIQFTVKVDFDSLSRLTEEFVTNKGVANSLVKSLQAAEKSAEKGNDKTVNGQITAYQNKLASQKGKSITEENSDLLTELADLLK
ncbi:family 43 glycosylhydrolase [Pseudalkalibacillus salsuginis]|uniref:family 43 glycosylhydrolase n=1 Tax=Pseudalkalibacillus salsuginis TaxID=2910972 RepID=UPI001F21C7DA|nr:family 43 glycosylhydrolase [Pseudalkalibacillus salsuginis]MCF6410234.1 family 43 glycosylhydrolase [Pseudalkalibacillus salsuginis]